MKTTKELIADLENAPKRKGIRYVNADDFSDAEQHQKGAD